MVIRSSTTWGLNMNLRDLARKHWDWVCRSKDLTSSLQETHGTPNKIMSRPVQHPRDDLANFADILRGPEAGSIWNHAFVQHVKSYDFLQISCPYVTAILTDRGWQHCQLSLDSRSSKSMLKSGIFHGCFTCVLMNIKKWGETMSRLKPFQVLGWIFSEMDPDV